MYSCSIHPRWRRNYTVENSKSNCATCHRHFADPGLDCLGENLSIPDAAIQGKLNVQSHIHGFADLLRL